MQAGLAVPGNLSNWLDWEAKVERDLHWRRSYSSFDIAASYLGGPSGTDWSRAGTNSAYSFAGSNNKDDKSQIRAYVLSVGAGEKYDSIQKYVKSIPKASAVGKGPFVHICAIHEADAKFNIGHYTAAEITACFREVKRAITDLRTAGNFQAINQVKYVVDLTAFYWNKSNKNPDKANNFNETLQDALLYGDIVAADPYGKGKYSASNLQEPFYDWCDANHKPSSIWEFSTTPAQPGGKPAWITEFFRYAYEREALYVLGFNSSEGGSSPLIGDAASLVAYRNAIDTYAVSGDDGGDDGGVTPPPVFEGMRGRVLNLSW